MNAARAGDGVDEVRTTESLRGEYAHLDEFRVDRDVVVALVHGRMVGLRHGHAHRARGHARRRDVGRRPARGPAPGHRHGAVARQPRPAGRGGGRRSAARTPGAALVRARHRGRRPRADRRPGLRPDPLRLRDAALPHRVAPRASAPRRPRAAAGAPGGPPRDLGGGRRGVPRPLGPPRADRGRLRGALRGPGDEHRPVVGRVGRRRGRRVRDDRDLHRGERGARDQAWLAGARVGAPAVARPRPREGAVRGLVPRAPRPRHGGGLARRRRDEPDRRAPALRAASGSRSAAAGRRSGGRWTARRPRAGPRARRRRRRPAEDRRRAG